MRTHPGVKPNILLVDDKPENLIALEKVLEDLDVEFVRALSGNEGLARSLRGDIALAIVDIQMPGMDGYQMVSLLRQGPKTRHIPVIFVSAIYSDDLYIIKGLESGGIDFITKPIVPEILRGKVRLFLEMHNQRRQLEQLVEELRHTQQQLIEERDRAEAATRAKSLFLASMSHEIRTPLNGIIGIVNILKQTTDPIKVAEYLEIVEISADNLLSIINDILDFSKIESQQLELENIPFHIEEEIQNVVKLLHFKATEKGLLLKAEIPGNIPSCVLGDPVRFKQILINLVNNAIKFTEKGFIEVSATLHDLPPDQCVIYCAVKDTGIGITEEGKLRLFREFSQTDKSISRRFGGSGLGLAISKKLVEMMQGEIGVESEYGKGSTFWFTVTFGRCDTHHTPGKTHSEISTGVSRHKNILLVEDNVINQKVALFALQKMGHFVDVAENGEICLQKVKEKDYDVVLMDVQMPIMDGYTATQRIRAWEKETGRKPLRIIAMTANAEKSERTYCLSIGMDEYISKPFKPERLAALLGD
ncbi:MAG: response regulator [Bacteroidales bacterium]|jgi:signal transduction histidine kinase|nr:response regulator [Bacteroidales bacterium]NPV36563.1 response regulator [Bacteroidales bacterium]